MKSDCSIVKVDPRNYRLIAKENWGLTDDQMSGMHVHHRIPVSEGGTNDPTNLYVCSPSFHAWVWHGGRYFTMWAKHGNKRALEVQRIKREMDPTWANKERERCSERAKKMHLINKGKSSYRKLQARKALSAVVTKRKKENWTKEEYDFVWKCHIEGITSGYLIAKRLGKSRWKRYCNMLRFASLGLSWNQLMDSDEYIEEILRIRRPGPISESILAYEA